MTTRSVLDASELGGPGQTSLSVAAARNLATTTKSTPQMQGISPRWLLRMLPWVNVPGGTYRVNRRATYAVGEGRVETYVAGGVAHVVPAALGELPALRGFADDAVLQALAGRFVQRVYRPGEAIVEAGAPADRVVVLAHGKATRRAPGKYDDAVTLGTLTDGDHVGPEAGAWPYTLQAETTCTALTLDVAALAEIAAASPGLRAHLERRPAPRRVDKHGQAEIVLAAGHRGEWPLPGTFVDYALHPREYELSVAQTRLRVHTRVADLYSEPYDQTEQQLRLTIEALRERQEWDLLHNREFGLLHNADLKQRLPTRRGPPTPDDLDDLLCRRRGNRFFLAHPRAIAAFRRACTAIGLDPGVVDVFGTPATAWRGVPLLPCDKLTIAPDGTTSILVMRTGEDDEGVIGLHQTGLPDEVEPGLSVRATGIDAQAVREYLVSAYFSAAVLIPDALGVLDDVAVGL